MYNTTELFKTAIRENGRLFSFTADITANKTFTVTKNKNVLKAERSWDAGQDISLGAVLSQSFTLQLANYEGQYNDIVFQGATIEPMIGLVVKTIPEVYETLSIGKYYVSQKVQPANTITVTGNDAIIKTNQPYITDLAFPASLLQITDDIANKISVTLADTAFEGADIVITEKPDLTDVTMRQMLSWVAQLAGSIIRLNNHEQIEFYWYGDNAADGKDINYNVASKMDIKESTMPISGVIYNDIILGTDANAFDLSDNPLVGLTPDPAATLAVAYNHVKDTSYYPFDLKWIGDYSYQPGDAIILKDKSGIVHPTYLMSNTLVISGGINSTSSAKTKTEEQRQYVSDTSLKTAQLRKKIKDLDLKVDDNRTGLEAAIEDAANLMTQSLGFYVWEKDGSNGWIAGKYISAVQESIADTNTEVWLQNANGFAHYPQGVSGPPDTALTANSTLVAKLVAAGIVTADMVKTGILQSKDGKCWINLDTGEFSLTTKSGASMDKIEADVTQLDADTTNKFQTVEQTIIENQSGTKDKFEEINKYIKFIDGDIIIGSDGKIAFEGGKQECGYWENRQFFAVDGEFINTLKLGKFAFIPRANGNLSFKKVMN